MMRSLRMLLTLIAMLLALAACVASPTVPVQSKYDQAWKASLGAVQDAGVKVIHAEPNSGLIRGSKDGIEVTVSVTQQPDGKVKVQFDTRGQTKNDPGLPDRFSQAYERRMGR